MRAPSSADTITPYNIFFSHKSKDAPVTKSIIRLITTHTENVRCIISEDIERGVDWRKAIAELLARTSILILIFTEPEEDWGWALYETGFFDALSKIPRTTHPRRIYCLHHRSVAPPSPMANLLAVPATFENVSRWLAELFSHTSQKRRYQDAIPSIAGQICQLFSVDWKPSYSILVPVFTIFLKTEIAPSSESVLASRIEADSYTLKLLSLQEGQWTLEDVKRAQSDKQWFNELIDNVVTIAYGRHTVPAKNLLCTNHGDFCPVISRIARAQIQLTLTVELVELQKEAGTDAFFGRPIPSKSWPQVFVAMPFLAEIDPIYRDHIKEVVETKIKTTVGRADDFYTNHEIMKDVWSAIYYSDVVIADCTGRNPNVFYEIGIAHTLGKKTILIAQKIDDIPFDVRHIRNIVYEYTPRGVKEFEKKLENTLRALFDRSQE
jgi:hypothetical protein